MKNILISILAFLVILFPWSSLLKDYQKQLTAVPYKTISAQVEKALVEHDVDAIVELLSDAAKEKLGSPEKIVEEFFNAFDGEIVEAKFHPGATTENMRPDYHYCLWDIDVKTTNSKCIVSVGYYLRCSDHDEKLGINYLKSYYLHEYSIENIYVIN